jgi:hypothetical protein
MHMLSRGRTLAALGFTLIVAGACGGGGDNATGPGGSTGGTYNLVRTNGDRVPAIEQVEDCSPSRFREGTLTLTADGDWHVSVKGDDERGPQVMSDQGKYERDGGDLSFESPEWGDFDGEIDGNQVVLHYDFCENGVADIDFEFQR